MSSVMPAKSILKQGARTDPAIADEHKAKTEIDRKNLKIALKHAYLIQQQKDVEAAIVNAITMLFDFPASSSFTSQEARQFLCLVQPFQPSDFDDLVEDRCMGSKCGYPLCPNPPRAKTMGKNAEWKLKKGMANWCSNDCAKKGLYVKAQLNEVPAWERVPEQIPDLQLHKDDRPPEDNSEVRRANRTARIKQWREKVENDQELAMERGEKPTSSRLTHVMADHVVEKRSNPKTPVAPQLDVGAHDSIEGHRPVPMRKSQNMATDDSDEEEDSVETDDDPDDHFDRDAD